MVAERILASNTFTETKNARYWEIDLVRGIGVVAMVVFHFVWDLQYFGVVNWNVHGTIGQSIARTIGSIFLLIVGISLSISYHRSRSYLLPIQLVMKYIKRGCALFGWGMVITIVTSWVLDAPVYFGVLHLIGAGIILSLPFLPRARLAGSLGIGIIICSLLTSRLPSGPVWLLPLGITQISHPMSDYYPIFPWFGVVLFGIYLGNLWYPCGKRRIFLPQPQTHIARSLVYLGQHALPIYLAHQPILFLATCLAVRSHTLK